MSEPKPAFDPAKRLTKFAGNDYLPVSARISWFRDESPNGTIELEHVVLTADWAVFKATITRVGDGGEVLGRASGYGSCTHQAFPKGHVEKASTKAIGRALGALGYGTEDVGDEDGDGTEHVADSPVPIESRRAVQNAPQRPQTRERPAPSQDTRRQTDARPGPSGDATAASTKTETISQSGIAHLHGEAKKRGITDHKQVHALAVLWCDVRSVKELTPKQLHSMLSKLTGGDRLSDDALDRDIGNALAIVQTLDGGDSETTDEAPNPEPLSYKAFWEWVKAEGLPFPADKLVAWLGEEIKHLTPRQAKELVEARRRDLAALDARQT